MHRAAYSDVHQLLDFEDLHEKQTVDLTSSQLSRHSIQVNFQIIFQSDKMNTKVNALIRMSLIDVSESTQRIEDHYQIILTLDKVNILAIESEVDLYQRVKDVNKTNELCNKYKQVISENKQKLHSTELRHCKIINNVLFRKDLL